MWNVDCSKYQDNVLVDKNDVALVADLGLAFFADPNSWLPNFEAVDGQPSPWHAPELKDSLDRSRPLERTFATDVFAFGCVCLEVSILLIRSYNSVYLHQPRFIPLTRHLRIGRVTGLQTCDQQHPSARKWTRNSGRSLALAYLIALLTVRRWWRFPKRSLSCPANGHNELGLTTFINASFILS